MLLRLGKRHTAAATKPALRHTLSCLLVPNAPLWGAAGAGAARTGPLQAILQQPACAIISHITSRTGLAALTASGSPQVPLSYATSPAVAGPLQGEGMRSPR